ncbi:hypothetical protein ACFSTE_16385 [Aquimarina hainanensis]|uniref:Uncharacterized protein n=1 Tax=Aquimarina hainanensis TaxID=1578017 RepID=A0ABW5NDW8_9FLAO|nr:hypothetical protein [Aquimarina sp. TRL1]QKX07069.1 hypothetical protein HN014_19840 [Aquimarina sp. TRL1]
MKNDELEITDLKEIIRKLISFIVVDGKKYISDDAQKRAYVLGYLHLLAKVINFIEEEDEFTAVENIADDISTYIE